MKRTEIKQLYDDPAAFTAEQITIAGWARTIRSSNVFGFIELNDGSYFIPRFPASEEKAQL